MDFVTAWQTHAEWREDFLVNATRELSKTGDLGGHAHIYRGLAAGLDRCEMLGQPCVGG